MDIVVDLRTALSWRRLKLVYMCSLQSDSGCAVQVQLEERASEHALFTFVYVFLPFPDARKSSGKARVVNGVFSLPITLDGLNGLK